MEANRSHWPLLLCLVAGCVEDLTLESDAMMGSAEFDELHPERVERVWSREVAPFNRVTLVDGEFLALSDPGSLTLVDDDGAVVRAYETPYQGTVLAIGDGFVGGAEEDGMITLVSYDGDFDVIASVAHPIEAVEPVAAVLAEANRHTALFSVRGSEEGTHLFAFDSRTLEFLWTKRFDPVRDVGVTPEGDVWVMSDAERLEVVARTGQVSSVHEIAWADVTAGSAVWFGFSDAGTHHALVDLRRDAEDSARVAEFDARWDLVWTADVPTPLEPESFRAETDVRIIAGQVPLPGAVGPADDLWGWLEARELDGTLRWRILGTRHNPLSGALRVGDALMAYSLGGTLERYEEAR